MALAEKGERTRGSDGDGFGGESGAANGDRRQKEGVEGERDRSIGIGIWREESNRES